MGQSRYDIVFLNFGIPLETRYNTLGELINLVYYLNRYGIKSAICIIPFPDFYSNQSKKRNKLLDFFGNFLSSHQSIENIVRKLFLHYSKEDLINIDVLKVRELDDLKKIDTRCLVSWLWESAYMLNKIKLDNGTKKIQILHYGWMPDFLIDYFPSGLLSSFKETYFSDMIKIAISKNQFDDFKEVKVYHWLQGINLKLFFNTKNEIKKPLQILMPLRRPKEKGAVYAIEATEIIHRQDDKIKIISYGDYQGNIPSFIEHHGKIDIINLIKLYREADIYILPSLAEGFSFPGLEAMASGCIIISTKNGGSEQYINDSVNGFLVEASNAEAIAEKISELIKKDQEYLKTIITNAQKSVLEYSYEKAAERFSNIIKEIDNSSK